MLDLNYVRENLESVRAALSKRGMPGNALDDFAQADAERRRVIGESDQLNAERNAASREIGALMKEGKREAADVRRREVNQLKDRMTELDPVSAAGEAPGVLAAGSGAARSRSCDLGRSGRLPYQRLLPAKTAMVTRSSRGRSRRCQRASQIASSSRRPRLPGGLVRICCRSAAASAIR